MWHQHAQLTAPHRWEKKTGSLATEEEVAVDNGACGGAAQGTPANSGQGGPIHDWREHQEFAKITRDGRERRERAPVVFGHGGSPLTRLRRRGNAESGLTSG